MSRQMGGRANGGGSDVARGAGFAAAKGAALIGLAVIIGIVLLQVVDDGSEGPVANAPEDETEVTTTTAAASEGDDVDDTTPDTTEAQLTPDQLSVLVLNGGAQQGAARAMSNALKQVGYTNQGEPADWPDREQSGNVVLCRSEFTREAAALAVAVGEGTVADVFPDPAPPGSDEFNCVVVVGAAA